MKCTISFRLVKSHFKITFLDFVCIYHDIINLRNFKIIIKVQKFLGILLKRVGESVGIVEGEKTGAKFATSEMKGILKDSLNFSF